MACLQGWLPVSTNKQVLAITMTSQWPRWRLKSPASRLFTQPFIQTQIKENIKAPRHWPLCGEFTGTGEFPAQRASYAENVSIWWRHHGSDKSRNTCNETEIWLFWRHFHHFLHRKCWMNTYTETEMLSFWWNLQHVLHWKLSKWKLSVQPVIKISSK